MEKTTHNTEYDQDLGEVKVSDFLKLENKQSLRETVVFSFFK